MASGSAPLAAWHPGARAPPPRLATRMGQPAAAAVPALALLPTPAADNSLWWGGVTPHEFLIRSVRDGG